MHTSEKDIRKAQKWLRALGSSVQVNGQMTFGLSRAIYYFQKKNDLPTTGELDKATWKKLKQENSWFKTIQSKWKQLHSKPQN